MEKVGSGRPAYDLAVVGGGPAGTAAAITAARMGARVLLLEKGSFPRHKVCGEFVSAESLNLLSSMLPGSSDLLDRAPRISQARIFVQRHCLKVPVHPPAASIPRFDLDAALWASAESSGVDIRDGQNVQHISRADHFLVNTSDCEFQAGSVINASGRWSNLSNKAISSSEKWVGLKAHFIEQAASPSVDLYFFEHGYCGVQPIGVHQATGAPAINVCAMVRADVADSLQGSLQCHAALANRSQSWRELTAPVATSPLIFRKPEPVRELILQAGDAAGFVDPFVGDGISLALRSGVLASQSLEQFFSGRESLNQALDRYQASYEQALLPIFRASSAIRKLLNTPEPLRSSLLMLFQAMPLLAKYLVQKTRR